MNIKTSIERKQVEYSPQDGDIVKFTNSQRYGFITEPERMGEKYIFTVLHDDTTSLYPLGYQLKVSCLEVEKLIQPMTLTIKINQ